MFIGFAPLSDPEIVTTCVIEHGSKGAWAGMAVRDVFTEYFDLDFNTQTEENEENENGENNNGNENND